MFYYSEQRYTVYIALFALSIHRWILFNYQLFLQKYSYDTIRNIHTGRYVHRTLRVQGVYGYYVVMWDTDQGPADLGYQAVCLLTHILDL